jgi:hypothetical protein
MCQTQFLAAYRDTNAFASEIEGKDRSSAIISSMLIIVRQGVLSFVYHAGLHGREITSAMARFIG